MPEHSEWTQPSHDEINILQNYLSYNFIQSLQKRVVKHTNKLIGYYRTSGIDKAFIKILPDESGESQNNAEQIASWLKHAGLVVNCVRDGFPKKMAEHGLWIFTYDYIDYEFSNRSEKQLYSIGKAMGHMHSLMREHPVRENVRTRGTEKNQILFEQLNKIRLGKVNLNFPKSAIGVIKETGDSDYQFLTLGAQMIHGDMNYGNVLVNKLNDQPIIIDFEDATTAWLSPLYDLAFVIQRFVLLHRSQDRYKLASAIIKGYLTQNTLTNSGRPSALFIMLKMISVRSLLVLSMLPEEDQKLYLDEVDKFVDLYRRAQDDSDLISNIDTLIHWKC